MSNTKFQTILKKHSMILMLCFVLFTNSNAQTPTEDVVYLKDGSVIRGSVLESGIKTKVRIISGGNQWVFDISEVDTVIREVIPSKIEKQLQHKEKGYYGIISLAPMHGYDNLGSGIKSFSIHFINGYQINERWALGIGTGIDFYYGSFYPIFLHSTFSSHKGSFSPFISSKLGYISPTWNNYVDDKIKSRYGGIMGEFGLGIKKYFSDKGAFVASIGYRYQETKSYNNGWWEWDPAITSHYYHRVVVRVGVLFR
ncbi:MAG: hypothetical protein IH948_05725 [Bacteroidetes bacterium]|nr:hypothetical protein [Bacteroidota bacterium]